MLLELKYKFIWTYTQTLFFFVLYSKKMLSNFSRRIFVISPKIIHLKLKQKLIDFVKTILPFNLHEIMVFTIFLVIYGVFAYYIATRFSIVFDDRIPWDAYFSFDNRAIVLTGGGFERHPLANYYFDWIRNFALSLSGGKMDATFRLVLALLSSTAVSLTMVQIFKYLKNIIQLPTFIVYFLTAFFGIFVTPILLSFTPETYTYTFFFLVFFNYYVALKFRKDENLSLPAISLFGLAIGGLTITNAVKVYFPILFEKKLFKSWKNFGWAALRVLFSVGLLVLLFLNRLNFDFQNFFTKTGQQYEKFSKVKDTPLWDAIYSWFFGGSMLFSSFIVRDYHNTAKTFYYKALFMDVYQNWLPYVFVGIMIAMLIWSYIKNFKNKLVQILMISFLVDIIIHCVLKFGVHTSYIYGGHYIFVVPLMIGWLFYAYRTSPKILSFLFSILCICLVYFGLNNGIRLIEFVDFLNLYYKAA